MNNSEGCCISLLIVLLSYAWEAVALLRRTIFVALSSLLWKYPDIRGKSFVIACLVMLSLHVVRKPFARIEDNRRESVSLFMLTGNPMRCCSLILVQSSLRCPLMCTQLIRSALELLLS